MVRYREKVQRSVDLERASGFAVFAHRPERNRLAPRKAVGVDGRGPGCVRSSIERKARMHVGIPKERLPQRRVVVAGFARFAVLLGVLDDGFFGNGCFRCWRRIGRLGGWF